MSPAHGAGDLIQLALAEDLSAGDVTTGFFVSHGQVAEAKVVAREACVVAGIETVREVFLRVDPALTLSQQVHDGDLLSPGAIALTVRGAAESILGAERVALNFLQRLSGVATLTARYVEAIRGTGARILDTRKTTPGMRTLEKAAAAAGGAVNHRAGLHDMVLVKDNHLAAAGGVSALVEGLRRVRAERPDLGIEVEVDTLDQYREVLTLGCVHRVLLDNFGLSELREAVALRPLGVELEASGGVGLGTVRAIAETGVDFISVGAITHSAPAVDFGLDFEPC
jgi:nicotinate-nucleotide pyrophosphorylase (carboxylating)